MMRILPTILATGIWANINVGADRETAIRIQLLEWQIGIANSSGIARNILNETDNLSELHPRNADHNLVRFKVSNPLTLLRLD